jgi:hypothetical protein
MPGRHYPALGRMEGVFPMRRHIIRGLSAAAAAGIAFLTLGFTGAGAPATAAAPSLGPPVYNAGSAGYTATGRWFRYVAATVTVPPVIPSQTYACNMVIMLGNAAIIRHVRYSIRVVPGGGSGSVGWSNGQSLTPIPMSPKIGDRLNISIYYDRNGHISFTAADVTQGITRTVQLSLPTGNLVLNQAWLTGNAAGGPVPSPSSDTRLWAVSGGRLTTYTGTRSTVTGPWQTSKLIQTSTGTASGTIVRSPSGLWNGGANFGIWLRHH